MNKQKGQTLIILLTYMVIAIIVTTAAVTLVINSAVSTDKVHQGSTALDVAESGVETAMIKLLRDPNYSGEIMSVENGQAIVTVTGTNPKTILSVGTLSNFTRTIQVVVDTSNDVYTTLSWKEI
jgi:Tfp pilus assembly protein PilX